MNRQTLFCAFSLAIYLLPSFVRASASYDDLFPFYIQACSVSRAKPIGKKAERPYGHTFIYLKGACRDKLASYPQLKSCEASRSIQDPETGVVVSVNSLPKNVNWVAIDGKNLGLYGRIKPGERLTQSFFDSLISDVMSEGYFKGIQIHEKDARDDDNPFPDVTAGTANGFDYSPDLLKLAKNSITYDFGGSLARNVYCTHVPINKDLLFLLINNLNQLNTKFFLANATVGPKHFEFQWSAITNSCAHLVYNLFSDLGFWRPLPVNSPFYFEPFNVAVPANVLIDIHAYVSTRIIKSPLQIYNNSRLRKIFLKYNWLPSAAGALFEKIPFHEPNDLYSSDVNLWFFDLFDFPFKERKFEKIKADPTSASLQLNLQAALERYQKIMATKPVSQTCPLHWSEAHCKDFKGFSQKYFEYISNELVKTIQRIQKLERP